MTNIVIPYADRVEICAEICAVIASSSNSISQAIALTGSRVAVFTFWRWRFEHADLEAMYARAKEEQTAFLLDEMLEIADTPMEGEKVKTKPDGTTERITGDMVEHRKLQIDTRKWIMAKLKPKTYGDKVDVTSGGEKLGAPTVPKDDADQIIDLIKTIEHQHILSPKAQDLLS